MVNHFPSTFLLFLVFIVKHPRKDQVNLKRAHSVSLSWKMWGNALGVISCGDFDNGTHQNSEKKLICFMFGWTIRGRLIVSHSVCVIMHNYQKLDDGIQDTQIQNEKQTLAAGPLIV